MNKLKPFLILSMITLFLISCGSTKSNLSIKETPITTTIDLVDVKNDQVKVTLKFTGITTDTISYQLPKIIPGTYSNDNYGKYIDDFKVFDSNGNPLTYSKIDDNRWLINNAKNLNKITYLVNDTFDTEDTHDVFSPAGSNIIKNKNYILNLHAFIGYFYGKKQNKYTLLIKHPKQLTAATSLIRDQISDTNTDDSFNVDVFHINRYADVVDSPIMYSVPDEEIFKVNDIEVVLRVYSPNKIHTAAKLKPEMERMMRAQKNFLGDINSTKKYSILLYLSTLQPTDATGFGALEHNTSTVVVLPESIPLERLNQAMVDVVSHEFFHIVTPLNIHSKEIHYFDFNTPKMSQHLWMYEGTTEYFAQLFQINQGLVSKEEFFNRMLGKINNAKFYDDTMSFTTMSKNILEEPYKKNYANVYEKGALISMCIDLIIREKSNGKQGILDLMKNLSQKYGNNTPFDDSELIDVVTKLTYPEVGDFLKTHIIEGTPINYDTYLEKAGLQFNIATIPSMYFIHEQQPYITGNEETGEVIFIPGITYNSFLKELGIQGGDVLISINDKKYTLANVYDLLKDPNEWKIGDSITFVIKRNGKEISLEGKVQTPTLEKKILQTVVDPTPSQTSLLKSWIND